MGKNRPWTVLPHRPLEKFSDNLWGLSGLGPLLKIPRRMVIVKRADGSLLFFNAVPMDESTLAEIRAWGRPEILIVPQDQHCIDAEAFRKHLGVKVYAPKKCAEDVAKKVELTGTVDEILSDPSIQFEVARGVKLGEEIMIVRSSDGTSLVFADVLQNHNPDKTPAPFRWLGFTGLKVTPLFKLVFLQDPAVLKSQLFDWANIPGLSRLIPSHGDVVTDDIPARLREVATKL